MSFSFDVCRNCDTLCVIKLSTSPAHGFACNCSSSYRVFILLQCVICPHFRNQVKIELHTHTPSQYHSSFTGRSFHLLSPTHLNSPFTSSAGRSSLSASYFLPLYVLCHSPPRPLPPPLPVRVSGGEREREEQGVIFSPLQRTLSASGSPSLCVSLFVWECVSVCCVCVYTVCMHDGALTQLVSRWNILLQWTGFLLKRWHGDYYSIRLHQIGTIPNWYYTSLCSWVIYPLKWTFISHIVKRRSWRCTIQRCLPYIDGFQSSENIALLQFKLPTNDFCGNVKNFINSKAGVQAHTISTPVYQLSSYLQSIFQAGDVFLLYHIYSLYYFVQSDLLKILHKIYVCVFWLIIVYLLFSLVFPYKCFCVFLRRYRLAGLPGDYQEKNISSPETNYCLLKDLIIWTQYQIQVAAYTGAGLGVYSSPVTEYTLQGGEQKMHTYIYLKDGCCHGDVTHLFGKKNLCLKREVD